MTSVRKIKNIYLVGMMGAGKSSLARLIAPSFHYAVVDLDMLIVDDQKKTINEIFSQDGESYFRAIEKRFLNRYSCRNYQVVATGGGIVLDEENIAMMKATGIMLYLSGTVNALYEHIKDDTTRPLLLVDDPKTRLADILHTRDSLYRKADLVVSIDGKSRDQLRDELEHSLEGKIERKEH
mgnify:CR=1 FL=1